MSYIRGTALLGFPELVAELGGDADRLLAVGNISRAAVGDQDSFISYRNGIEVLQAAARQTSTPDLGRRLALRQGIEILGPVGVAVRTAPTVGAAFQALDQYLSVYSPAISASISPGPTGEDARFEFRILLDRLGPHQQAVELALGVVMQMFRLIIGPNFRPVSADLPHEPLTAVEDYVRYFGCTTRFSSERSGFVLRRSDLARPLSSDGAVHDMVRDYLNSVALPAEGHTREAVRLMIRQMLPTGGLEIALVASHLNLHQRTLQRKLADQGASFQGLVDEVRRSQAGRYLRETEVPLTQLAGLVGYTEQSALTRSCHRWFGVSPSSYRKSANPPA